MKDEHPTKLVDHSLDQVMPWMERGLVWAILGLLGLVVGVSTLQLAWIVLRDVVISPLLLSVAELQEIFGLFLLLAIGVWLMAGVRAYAHERVLRAGVVLEVALLAAVRQLLMIDLVLHDGLVMVGIAALVIASAGGLYLERTIRARAREVREQATLITPTPAAGRPALPVAVDDSHDLRDPTDPPRRSRVATRPLSSAATVVEAPPVR